MVLGHAAAGRRFGGRGGRGGGLGASVGGGAAQFRRRGELGLAPSENRRIGQQKLTKYPYHIRSYPNIGGIAWYLLRLLEEIVRLARQEGKFAGAARGGKI